MSKIVVFGSSDDLIRVSGDIEEEFNVGFGEVTLLGISDGTLLRVEYTDDGLWDIRMLHQGPTSVMARVSAVLGDGGVRRDDGSPEYSDSVHLVGPEGSFTWIVCGDSFIHMGRAK